MAAEKPSSVRFDKLIEESGAPESITLWIKPEHDKEFMRAVKGNRIVTVHQHTVGTKKDFGVVGFSKEKNSLYLRFPRRIPAPTGTKIIGLKYEKLTQSQPRGPLYKPAKAKPSEFVARQPKKTEPISTRSENRQKKQKPLHHFSAAVHLIAEMTVPITVEALSKQEAVQLIQHQAEGVDMELAKAQLRRKLGPVKKL